jgi:glycolate dehydrogenase iron-sulfur subunit
MTCQNKMEAGEIHRCNRCGLCLAVCPVYGQRPQESLSPRAKVQLIKHYALQELAPSLQLRDIVSQCLM